jgi:hypothetical protein
MFAKTFSDTSFITWVIYREMLGGQLPITSVYKKDPYERICEKNSRLDKNCPVYQEKVLA